MLEVSLSSYSPRTELQTTELELTRAALRQPNGFNSETLPTSLPFGMARSRHQYYRTVPRLLSRELQLDLTSSPSGRMDRSSCVLSTLPETAERIVLCS